MNTVRVALVGFGGIARAHNTGYNNLKAIGVPVELVAVCDVNSEQFESQMKINVDTGKSGLAATVHTYTDVDEMLAKEDFDMADICLPTYLHPEYAVKMLKAGKHVLSEKPMALTSEGCNIMIETAKQENRKLMIGQCLRFSPIYLFLKDCLEDKRFGELKHIFMNRLSAQPRWGFEHWFEDTDKSGGCILDMHIHDVDMVRFLLGEPKAVSALTIDGETRWQVENTRMYYDNTLVVINGSWDEAATCPFYANYRARFEKASVIFENGSVKVYPDEGEPYDAQLRSSYDHMTEEIHAFIDELLAGKIESDVNPSESAKESVRVVEKLRESAAQNGAIITL